ncbi:hypothetical protein [Lysinibacillus xylanilyticus]|nr:hypothetical protein [Lysinibacillus xylanilyticus]
MRASKWPTVRVTGVLKNWRGNFVDLDTIEIGIRSFWWKIA